MDDDATSRSHDGQHDLPQRIARWTDRTDATIAWFAERRKHQAESSAASPLGSMWRWDRIFR